jgi:hypothetical protein
MAVEPRGKRRFAGLLEAGLDATLNKLRKSSALKPDHTSRHGRLKGCLLGGPGIRDKENGSYE